MALRFAWEYYHSSEEQVHTPFKTLQYPTYNNHLKQTCPLQHQEGMNKTLFTCIFEHQHYFIFISKVMGSQLCTKENPQLQFSSASIYEYRFGQDDKQLRIIHEESIQTRQPSIQKSLKDCQERLIKSQKMFKDNSMKTQPIILKSLRGQEEQVKCTYHRPYVFLSSSTATRGKAYKIINQSESRYSQILVRDQALQHFGVFLCFIADNPHLLRSIILTGPNTYGIHSIKVNVDSVRQPIFIDDYTLCSEQLPIFSQPVRGEKDKYMWTCLLEKAWIKVNGNIAQAINRTDQEELFKTFLSYPMKTELLKEQLKLYQYEEGVLTQNHKLLRKLHGLDKSTGCIFKTRKNPKHKIGISGGKQFYFITYFEHKGCKLYYLRNPCPRLFDFRGKYSNLDEELVKKIQQVTGQEKIAQGNFVLQEQEVLEQLESIFTIHYSPSSRIVSEEPLNIQDEKELFLELDLKDNADLSICFQQNNFQKIYSPLSFLIIERARNQIVSDLKNVQGSFGVQNTYLLQNIYKHLKAGKYLIRLLKKRVVSKAQTISKQGSKLVITAPFQVNINQQNQPHLKAAYLHFLKDYGRDKLMGNKSHENRPNSALIQSKKQPKRIKHQFKHIGFWIGDLAAVYIRKMTDKKQVKLEIGFPELQNLKCTSQQDIRKDYSVFNLSQEENLIVFEKIDLSAQTKIGNYVIQPF